MARLSVAVAVPPTVRDVLAPVRGLDELGEAVYAAIVGLVPVTHPQPFAADVVLARGRPRFEDLAVVALGTGLPRTRSSGPG